MEVNSSMDGQNQSIGMVGRSQTEPASLTLWMFKWSLIGLVILIPIVLLPVIAIFTRRNRERSRGNPPGQSLKEVPEKSQLQVRNLPTTINLLPTKPGADVYIRHVGDSSIVRVNRWNNRHFYHLAKENTVECIRTGQLYHPLSGMMFNPLHGYMFNIKQGNIVHIESAGTQKCHPNQVYNPETSELYERCFSMCYDPLLKTFHLPTVPKYKSNELPIRFMKPQEMPDEFVNIYSCLMEEKQETGEVMKPVGEQTERETPRDGTPRFPLLIDKRNFAIPQTEDDDETPRSIMRHMPVPMFSQINPFKQNQTTTIIACQVDTEESRYITVGNTLN